MALTTFVHGTCICGRYFMVLQPEHGDMAEMLSGILTEHADIFVCDRAEAFCSQCGQAISMPIPEQMDVERTNWAEFAKWIESFEARSNKLD